MGLLDSLKALFGGKKEEASASEMPTEAPAAPAPTMEAPAADLGAGDSGATPEVTKPVA